MKRIVLIGLICLMVVSLIPFSVSAESNKEMSYEIVMLIDVSGSMNLADPQRISIESAKAFAYLYPYNADFFNISVVLYNTDVLTAVESVNISEEKGMQTYQTCLDTIGKLGQKGEYNGFVCWDNARDTDIGLAMMQSKQILAKSKADKKAVLLFTDGKIDLDKNPLVVSPAEKQSEQNSYDCAEYYASSNIPVYTVGLNRNNGVDGVFMQKLADMTGGDYQACKSADELTELFWDIYGFFTNSTTNSDTTIIVQPNVETKHKVNIFGQAISEANLILFSSTVIKSYKVTNPNGAVIAEMKEDGSKFAVSGCLVNQNDYTINIKLINPTDGDWSVSFMSATSGTVRIGEIYLYNLEVADSGLKSIAVGDSIEFVPVLFNTDTDKRVTTKAIYETSKCYVMINKDGAQDVYTAKLNSAKDGYFLEHTFTNPGDYEIIYRIVNDQFEVESKQRLEVLPPNLTVAANNDTYELGDAVNITCKIQHPISGASMVLPDYIVGFELIAEVKVDGRQVFSGPVKYTGSGEYAFTYMPLSVGSYTVSVQMKKYNDSIASTVPTIFNVKTPELNVKANKATVERGDQVDFTISLKNPVTGADVNISSYYKNCKITADVKLNGKAWKVFEIDSVSDTALFNFVPDKKGEYSIAVTLSSDGTTLKSNPISVVVKESSVVIPIDQGEININDGVFPIVIEILDINGNKTTTCPDYMKKYTVTFKCGNTVGDPISFFDFIASGGKYDFVPQTAGEYTVIALIEGEGEPIELSVDVSVQASVITFDDTALPDIIESTLGGTSTKEIELSEIFKDSDGDSLVFDIETDNEDDITFELTDGVLVLNVKSGSEGVVTINVSDGKGAECSAHFEVKVKSLMPLLITGIVILVIIIVSIPIALMILKKRRIPRIKYCVKLGINDDVAIFDINRASNNRFSKPVMTVKEILRTSSLSNYFGGDMSEDDIETMINDYCSKLSVTGFAFKDCIKIMTNEGKERVFDRHTVKISFPDDEERNISDIFISFGKISDFHDDSLL